MVMTLLRRAAGEKTALDLALTGRVLAATEARAAGLLARVVPDDDLEREVSAVVGALVATGPSAVALTKELFYRLDGRSFEDGIALGARVNALARQTPEFRAAIAQFLRR
jgi:enoyl-CoA hydratase/carnithine racemase